MQYLFMNNLMPFCIHVTRWPQLPLANASAIRLLWQCPQLLLPACSCHNSRDNMPQSPCMFTLLRCPPPTSPLLKAFFTGRSIPYGCAMWICAMASPKPSLPTGSPETHLVPSDHILFRNQANKFLMSGCLYNTCECTLQVQRIVTGQQFVYR